MSAGTQTLIFGDHKFSNINVGETAATELLGVIGGVLATAGTFDNDGMVIAENLFRVISMFETRLFLATTAIPGPALLRNCKS